jgi:hypothetical protein
MEEYEALNAQAIEKIKNSIVTPFTVEQATDTLKLEKQELLLAYTRNPLDKENNEKILQAIELLKEQIIAADRHVLNLRKEIENQVKTKNLSKEILAEIMTIESINANQLKQLLIKIL